eukprot:7187139-Pyramimonas_sp.AAC.1
MGKIRAEVESVVKPLPKLEEWKVNSSVGSGFVFIANEPTGDALKLFSVQKPLTVFEQPRVIACACHFEQIGLAGKPGEMVAKVWQQLGL